MDPLCRGAFPPTPGRVGARAVSVGGRPRRAAPLEPGLPRCRAGAAGHGRGGAGLPAAGRRRGLRGGGQRRAEALTCDVGAAVRCRVAPNSCRCAAAGRRARRRRCEGRVAAGRLPARDGVVVRLTRVGRPGRRWPVRTYTRAVALVRIAVVVVLVASGLVVLYGLILDRSGQNIAFTVAGLAVLGLTLAFISAWFLTRALTDARWGRSGGSLVGAARAGSARSPLPVAWQPRRSSPSSASERTRCAAAPRVHSLGRWPPSSRGLGRHPFKVEIRGSNPLGGANSPPFYSVAAMPHLTR